MKILHIIDSLGLGGAQTLIKDLFEIENNKNDLYLYVLRKKEINFEIKNSKVLINNSNKKYSFSGLKELKKLIEEEKIEILHCHLFKSQVFGYILKKKYFPNIKLVFHEHGQIFGNSNNKIISKIEQKFYYYFMKLSKTKVNLYIGVSNATKKKLIEKIKINRNRIKTIQNFINSNKYNPNKIKIKNKTEFVIGFAGRLSEVKGCIYLVRAMKYLDSNLKCIIAGEGELKEKLMKISKEEYKENQIKFIGYTKNMIDFYSKIDILIVPSLFESFGLTVIEAQSLNIPVIASNVEALNEIIIDNETGLLFEAKNEKDLAKKINLIFTDKKLKNNIIKNALLEIDKYSLEKYIIKLNTVYEELK